MAEYRNSFHSTQSLDPATYRTEAQAVEYRGYLIYNRINAPNGRGCWDVVKDGACIGQYAGRNGAKGFVDSLLDGQDDLAEFQRKRVERLLVRL